MHRIRSGIVAAVVAAALAGCGDSAIDEGPGGFKPTDTKPLEPMLKQMQDSAKTRAYTKRQVVPSEKEKAKETEKKK